MTPLENKVSPRKIAEQKYKSARNNLLLMIGFTVINIVLLVVDAGVMFLFSATIPYYATLFGMMVDNVAAMTALFLVAAFSIIAYLVCWIFSKKHFGWMIGALVLFVVDTVAMGRIALSMMDISAIIDVAFHAWVIFYLVMGISNGSKLRNLPKEEIEQAQSEFNYEDYAQAPSEAPNAQTNGNTATLRMADMDVKARILLETDANGKHIVYRRVKRTNELVIDGYVYDELEALVESAHTLSATIDGNLYQVGFDGAAQSFAKVNGEKIAKKTRLW